MHQPIVLDRSS